MNVEQCKLFVAGFVDVFQFVGESEVSVRHGNCADPNIT